MKIKTQYFIISLFLLSFLVPGCNSDSQEEKESQAGKTYITAIRAKLKEYTPEKEYSGILKPSRQANLGAVLPGRVEKIHCMEGEKVKKGQLLVSMSAELYTQALVEYETLKKDYQRVKNLLESESISRQDYDHVEARYKASEAKLEMLQKSTRILAPFDGTVVDFLVEEGENYLISPSLDPGYSTTSGIIRLMKQDPMYVEFNINEKEIIEWENTREISVALEAFPDTLFKAKMKGVKPLLNTLSHTATATAVLNNHSGIFWPGMYARVICKTDPKTGIALPHNTIRTRTINGETESYVWVIRNGKSFSQKIEYIEDFNNEIIVKGIENGDMIASAGLEKLKEEMEVNVKMIEK